MKEFWIRANGSDAPVAFESDDYEEAAAWAKAQSHHWLGMAMHGPSGKIATFSNGVRTGYLGRLWDTETQTTGPTQWIVEVEGARR